VEQSALLTRLTPLLEPNELQLMGLAQPLLQLRGATAALERQRSLKRCRHLLDAWSSQRLETLERCIALLLEEERREADASASGLAPVSDMESRIDSLFADLNGDALRFQDLYYNERRYLTELDSRRCAGYEEVVQQDSPEALTA
jgi:DNA primase